MLGWLFEMIGQIKEIVFTALVSFLLGYYFASKIIPKKLERKRRKNWSARQVSEINAGKFDINTVKNTEYFPRNVLNEGERRLFYKLIKHFDGDYNVHAQVSLGEILQCPHDTPDALGYRAINSKRCDFTISKRGTFSPVAVIEYQGAGHYQGNSEERDAIKKLAIEKAGLLYISIAAYLIEDRYKEQLRKKLEHYFGPRTLV